MYRIEKLGKLAQISAGGTPKRSNISYWKDGDIPWVKISDMNEKYTSKSEEMITELGYQESSTKLFPANTILLTIFATVGEVSILDFEACTNQAIAGIQFNKSTLEVDFVYYYLRSIKSELRKAGRGVAQSNINLSILRNLDIPLPSKNTQKKIADTLDLAWSLIEKRKQQLVEMDRLIQSVFYEMFGDPIKNEKNFKKKRLSEIGTWASGGTPKRSNDSFYKNGSIPWITSGELNSLYLYESIEYITEESIQHSSAKLIPKDSLLIGMYDTAALKSSITRIQCACNQAIAFSKLNSDLVSTIFVYYCIQFSKDYYKMQQRGVRQKNLNLSMIKNIEILYPDKILQNKFASIVEEIEAQKKVMEQSLAEMENNFNALMQKAFKGELFPE